MSTPQDPPVRHRQKIRRTKQLAAWRIKNPPKAAPEKKEVPAKKTVAKK